MKPLVSICIPTFNGEAFLQEAMESAMAQTYSNLEIIVSDDRSKDHSLKIIESFRTKTTIPIYIYMHQPQGIGSNWNHCVQKSNGDFIKFLFQDDILLPICIERMMEFMSDSNVGLVYSRREFICNEMTEENKAFLDYYGNLHEYWHDLKITEGVLSGKAYLKNRKFLTAPKNKIGEPTNVLLRKICFEKVGYFNQDLQQALDSDFWYRVMKVYDVGFVDAVLAKFRLHPSQASSINKTRDIPDKEMINHLYYRNLFWQLHPKNQLKLLKNYHPLFKLLLKLKRSVNA